MTRWTVLLSVLAVGMIACGDNRLPPEGLGPQDGADQFDPNNPTIPGGIDETPEVGFDPALGVLGNPAYIPEFGVACATSGTCYDQIVFCSSGSALLQTADGSTLENLEYGVSDDEIWTLSDQGGLDDYTYKPDGTLVGPFGNILVNLGVDVDLCNSTSSPELLLPEPEPSALEQNLGTTFPTMEEYTNGSLDYQGTDYDGYYLDPDGSLPDFGILDQDRYVDPLTEPFRDKSLYYDTNDFTDFQFNP